MKNLFLLFAFALFSLPIFGQGVDFQDLTPEEAVAKAKAENKHVFVDVYTDWCGPCHMMDAQVFPLKEVGDYFNPRFISIKVNAEKGKENAAFAKGYGVKAYPTFIVLNGDNELVHMFAGGILDLSFINKVAVAFDQTKAFGALKKRYDAGDKDRKLVAAYIEALKNTHSTDVSKMVDEFYDTLSDEDKIFNEAVFMFDQHAPLGSKRELFLTENRDRFREVVGHEKIDSIMKMKYVMYFSHIIQGYNRSATTTTIEEIGNKIVSLGLLNANALPVYRAAAIAKVSATGEEALFEMIKAVVPHVSTWDMDYLLLTVMPPFKKVWNEEQLNELLEFVSHEPTKGYISRSVNQ